MYMAEPNDQAYLIRDLGSSLQRKHHIRRLLISAFLCLGPLLDTVLLWCIACWDISEPQSKLFKYFVLSYTVTNVLTSFIGFGGIFFENGAALRSSLALIIMQNTLMLIYTSLVLICLLFKFNLFVLHHAPLFLQYLETNRKFGIICCLLVIAVRASCYFMVWSIGELEASYEKSGYMALKTGMQLDYSVTQDNVQIDIPT